VLNHRSICTSEVKKDEEREYRITMEAIVDANGPEEQAMGWYYYLDDKIQFHFQAKCIEASHVSPLKVGEIVQVLQMSSEDECMHEMFIEVEWQARTFAIPLAQIQAVNVDVDTQEAIEDWHY
jgi:Calcium binding protein from Anabaena CcbP.